ncbi:MAG: T9SS type A sorting domain-containing protein [Ignavibacteriae bacterium]|nr:T9SS type A sorting domain-containing protein [Ignavibacteriota bacterium]
MKRNRLRFYSIIIFLSLIVISTTWGQERIIEENEGFVNQIILGDTLADGSQAHNVYIFKRGAKYFVNGQISNVGFIITLKAESGTGTLPIIRNWPDANGELGRILDANDDAYVYNLYLDGMGPDLTTTEPDPLYTMNGQLLRAGAAGKVLVVDGCVLNNVGQTIIRSNSGARKVQVTNSIIANAGQLSRDNLGNGRIIDFRNGITDTVIFRNCTMVNSYDRLIRHYGAAANSNTAYVNYLELDHNTIVHNTGAYGFIYLGDISGSVKITNNLFYNPMTLGVDPADQQRFAEISSISEVGPDGNPVNPLIIEQPNDLYNPTYLMSNNIIAYDQTVKEYMTANNVTPAPALAPRLASKVTGSTPFTDAEVTLTNIPNVMIEVMNWYRPLAVAQLAGGMITTTEVDMDRRNAEYWLNELDASYTTSNPAFIGTDGKPIGADWGSKVNQEQVVWNEKVIEENEGFVNQIILGDTLSDGSQAHNAYIFKRGATYFVNGQISNIGFEIKLAAESGTGTLPIIRNWPDANGELGRILDANDDAYVYNLYLDGMGPDLTTTEPDPLYTMNGQLLRAGAAGKVLVVDGCVLNNVGQTIIRSNSGARKVQVTNSIIANAGQLSRDNLGNGRIIDFRNGITDTVIFRNCTMVNSYDRLIRHYGAAANSNTAYVNYLELDHNTIVHNTGAYGFIYLGDISGSVKITNNLFYNPMTLGVDPADQQRFAEISSISEVGPDGNPVNPLIIEQPNDLYNPTYLMSNNIIAYDQTVKEYMTANNVTPAPALAPRLASKVTGSTPFTDAEVTLTNIPNVMIEVMNWYRPLAVAQLAGGMITTTEVDMDRRNAEYWLNELDASYTTSNPAFIGTDSKPIGAEWGSVITSIESNINEIPVSYMLNNNYPNPFNPTTTISFGLPEKSIVSLSVFNILGQKVFELKEQNLSSGIHSYNFDASQLTSGIYIYTINATGIDGQNFVSSKKMTLLK